MRLWRCAELGLVLAAAWTGVSGPACAQNRASENVLTQAEDAFGTSLGRETIGLYDSSNVRGFSPTSAGNARIDGLYFDQVWGLNARLRRATNIRVGISAFGFPFPAPTGVVDYQMRRPGAEASQSAYASADSYGAASLELDAVIPVVEDELSLGAGVALYNNEYYNGTNSQQHIEGLQALWRPGARFELQPFFVRSDIHDDEIGAIYVPAGAYLPPAIERRRFNGPNWAVYNGTAINYGVLSSWRPTIDWTVRAGLFRSLFDDDVSHFNLIVDLTPDGRGQQIVSVDPPSKIASTSGELRLTRAFVDGTRLHQIHLSLRGRERIRRTGGSDEIDLGPVTIGETQTAPQPAYNFSERTQDRVRQWIGGIAYEGRWRDRGELSLGLQYADYEKRTAQPGLPVAISQADPWLWNAALAINLTPRLVVYAGATRGLEESGVAPIAAANRNAALPAIETEQIDAGVRWRIAPDLRLVAGVFDVRKPYFNLDEASVWRELGDVRNRGVELSLSGQVRPGLSVVAGAVLLDAKVTGEGVRLGRVGERPVGSTPTTLLFSVDWAPQAMEGASLDFGVSHAGDIVATRDNRVELPARTTLDVGLRYPLKVGGQTASLRAQVTNLTDEEGFDLSGSGAYDIFAGRVFSISLAADF